MPDDPDEQCVSSSTEQSVASDGQFFVSVSQAESNLAQDQSPYDEIWTVVPCLGRKRRHVDHTRSTKNRTLSRHRSKVRGGDASVPWKKYATYVKRHERNYQPGQRRKSKAKKLSQSGHTMKAKQFV